jgi:hypothetical protein
MSAAGFVHAHQGQSKFTGLRRRFDRPTLETKSRLLNQDERLVRKDVPQVKATLDVGHGGRFTGPQEDPGAGDRFALAIEDLTRHVPELSKPDGGNRGPVAAQGHPVRD